MIDRIAPITPILPNGREYVTCPRCEQRVVRVFAHSCIPVITNAREARRALVLGIIRPR
jgi:hypothetical protein